MGFALFFTRGVSAVEQFSNLSIGFLNGAVTSTTATSITLHDSTSFPSIGNFTVKCDNEIMLVSANASNVLTVARGQEGTTAATHVDGSPMYAVISAGSLQRLAVQSVGGTVIGARRQLNFISGTGVTWTLTDDPTNNKIDIAASATSGNASIEAAYTAPVLANFAWTNQGTGGTAGSVAQNGPALFIRAPTLTGNNARVLDMAPGTGAPYTMIAKIKCTNMGGNYLNGGVSLRDSSTGKLILISFTNGTITVSKYTNPTTYSAGYSTTNQDSSTSFQWIKVQDDNTNRKISFSVDGTNWFLFLSTTRSDFCTPDHVGFYAESNNGQFDAGCNLLSWAISNP